MTVSPAGNLLVFGASVRAAAFSALRAGLRPWCADLFADADLRAHCPVTRVSAAAYPRGFLGLVDTDLPGPWMYTGRLENWPALVGEMARRRRLWGNGQGTLARTRDPFFLTRALHQAGLPAPAVCADPRRLPPGGRWLVKPVRGA